MNATGTIQATARAAAAAGGSLLLEIEHMARGLVAQGRPIVFLLRGEPDFETPRHIIEKSHEAMLAGHTHYTAAEGILPLREAVSDHLVDRYGIRTDPATEVVITTGATMGLHLALQVLLEPGDEVLGFGPYYGPYSRIVRYAGGSMASVPMSRVNARWSVDTQALADQITAATKAIIVNTPSNPSGTVLTRAELEQIAALAEQHNLAILSDECYNTIVYDGKEHVSVASLSPEAQARTIVINSFSKSYAMTGWRLGYVAAKRGLAEPMRQMFNASARCATSFAQHAATAALRGPQDAVDAMAKDYARRRAIALEELAEVEVPYTVPEGTFYFFLDCREFGLSSLQLAKHALEVGDVAATPGRFFGEDGEGFLRLSFAVNDDDLRTGIRGLARALKAL